MILFLAIMLWLTDIPLANSAITFAPGGVAASDAQGNYTITVEGPWSGTITPSYPGCTFLPTAIAAQDVVANATVVTFHCTDIEAPSVQITVPANNTALQRGVPVTLTATAADNIGVARIDWTLDGVALGSGYTLPWTATGNKKKSWHKLTAKAFDLVGNSAAAAVSVRF